MDIPLRITRSLIRLVCGSSFNPCASLAAIRALERVHSTKSDLANDTMTKHSVLIFLLLMLLSIDISIGEISIDKDRCETDTMCLMPQHCTNQAGSNFLVPYDGLNISTDCNVMFQLKPFTEKKYLVKMQVTSDTDDLDMKRGLTLLLGTQTVSFCSETVSNMSTFSTDNIISMSSGTNIVTNSTIQCSQFIISPDKDVSDHLSSSSYKFTLSFSRGNDTDEKYVSLKTTDVAFIDIIKRIGCDPDKVDSSIIQQPSDVYLTTIPDTTQPSFDCSQEPGQSTYVQHGGQLKQVTDLKCEEKEFTYKDSLNKSAAIPAADKFNVYCGVPVCSMCTSIPAYNCSSCSAAVFHASTNGSCASLACPDNRWIYNSGDHITATPKCKRSNSARGGYVWMMEKDQQDIEMHKGACSQQYDCATTNPLKSECNSTGRLCAVVRIKDPIKCSDSSSKMIVKTSANNTKSPKTIACDDSNGNWYAAANKSDIIAKGSNVYCEPDLNSTLSSSNSANNKEKSDNTVYYIAGGGGLLLLLVIIGGTVGFICYRRRNKRVVEEKEEQLRIEEKKRKDDEGIMNFLLSDYDKKEKLLAQETGQKKTALEERKRALQEKIEMETQMKNDIAVLLQEMRLQEKEREKRRQETPREKNMRIRPDAAFMFPDIADIETKNLRSVEEYVKHWKKFSIFERVSFVKDFIFAANHQLYALLLRGVGEKEVDPLIWGYILEGTLNLLRLTKDLAWRKYGGIVGVESEEIHAAIHHAASLVGQSLFRTYITRIKPQEVPAVGFMRYVASRLLYHFRYRTVTEKLNEWKANEHKQPITEPLRILVWAHAARAKPVQKTADGKVDPAEEKKTEESNSARYQTLFDRLDQPAPQDDKPDDLGTYHQHVIRALAVADPSKSDRVLTKILNKKELANKDNMCVFFRSLVEASCKGHIPVELLNKHMTAILSIAPKGSAELVDIVDNAGRCCVEESAFEKIQAIVKQSTCSDLLPNVTWCKGLYLNHALMRDTTQQEMIDSQEKHEAAMRTRDSAF